MQNKTSQKNWTDVQLIISSIAIASTVSLWSLFAAPQKKTAGVAGEVIVPPQPNNIVIAQPQLAPGQKLLFGGTAPKPQVIIRNTGGGGGGGIVSGGGGGGTGGGTGSSRP